jgi:hypothetical protein
MLAMESVDNELKPERKHRLLIALAERRDARIIDAAAPFLADFDEGVRNAAVEAIAAQEAQPGAAGRQVWVLQATGPGTATVSTTYGRPWEGGEKDAWTFTANVTVQ